MAEVTARSTSTLVAGRPAVVAANAAERTLRKLLGLTALKRWLLAPAPLWQPWHARGYCEPAAVLATAQATDGETLAFPCTLR